MIYRILGKTGFEVSCIGQGCWNIGNQWKSMEEKEARAIIREAYDCGINLYDVADNYGQPNGTSELRLGKCIQDIRNNIYIVSKIGHWGERSGQPVPYTTPDMIRLCGHASLGRLQTSYLDEVLCHDGFIEDPTIFIEGLEALKKEGFVREYGISTDSLEVLKRFYEMSDGHCSVVELEYSIVCPEAETNGLLDYCREKNLGVLVRGPLAQGLVSGKYTKESRFTDSVRINYNKGKCYRQKFEHCIDIMERIKEEFGDRDLIELALQYVNSNEAALVSIPGATNIRQVRSNARAGEQLLDNQSLERLRRLNQ